MGNATQEAMRSAGPGAAAMELPPDTPCLEPGPVDREKLEELRLCRNSLRICSALDDTKTKEISNHRAPVFELARLAGLRPTQVATDMLDNSHGMKHGLLKADLSSPDRRERSVSLTALGHLYAEKFKDDSDKGRKTYFPRTEYYMLKAILDQKSGALRSAPDASAYCQLYHAMGDEGYAQLDITSLSKTANNMERADCLDIFDEYPTGANNKKITRAISITPEGEEYFASLDKEIDEIRKRAPNQMTAENLMQVIKDRYQEIEAIAKANQVSEVPFAMPSENEPTEELVRKASLMGAFLERCMDFEDLQPQTSAG